MAFLSSILKKALKAIGERILMNMVSGDKEKRGNTWKVLIITCVLVVYFLMASAELLLGGVVHLVESFTSLFKGKEYTKEEIQAMISDAGSLLELIEKEGFVLDETNSFMMDDKTLKRVLKAVAEYNEEMSLSKEITYEYKVETTSVVYDEVEVEVEVEDVDTAESSSDKNPPLILDNAARPVIPNDEPEEEQTETKTEIIQVPSEQTDVSYEEETITLSTKEIDSDPDEVGEDIFYLSWQPILVLCDMYIQENVEKIGTYEEEDSDGKSFYLSNEAISEMIDILCFDYTYYRDYCRSSEDTFSYDFIEEGIAGYRLSEYTETSEGVKKKITKRIPAIAPKDVKNSYLKYEYVYEMMETGEIVLKERTCTLNPVKFIEACKSKMPSFDAELFVYLLSCLPGTEELCSYYGDTVIPMAENGSIYTNTVNTVETCPSIGVRVSNSGSGGFWDDLFGGGDSEDGGIEWDEGSMEWDGESYYLPLYPINGWGNRFVKPGAWIVQEGNSYGSYEIYYDAMKSLTVSDGFTLEEMQYLFLNYGFSDKSPLFANEQAVLDTAQCFYDYQQNTGTSVCGLLGIMRQEGGFASAIARNGWNFFNIKATSGQPVTSYESSSGTVTTDFRNYRAEYENGGSGAYKTAAVNALAAQMNWVNRYYWSKGQNSYYLMIWNGYNVEEPQRAYETISHSYCPPWDDQAMPYSQDSYVIKDGSNIYYWKNSNSSYGGWINGCAKYRYQYYMFVRG